MNLFPLFQTVLYTISTALLYPVVCALILLSVWTLVYAGGFAAEWVKRRRFKSSVSDVMDQIHAIGQLPDALEPDLPRHIVTYAGQLSDLVGHQSQFTPERVEDLNQQTIAGLQNEVDKIRLVVRVGPSLGLMGTLIPMGTGLAGLTQGNMAQLSSSLILAFTTTVVGLALGIGAHFFTVIRTRWMISDLRLVNMITEAIARKPGSSIKEVKAA